MVIQTERRQAHTNTSLARQCGSDRDAVYQIAKALGISGALAGKTVIYTDSEAGVIIEALKFRLGKDSSAVHAVDARPQTRMVSPNAGVRTF